MMKVFVRQNCARVAVLCCSIMLLSACDSMFSKPKTIEERATARWELLFSGDFAGAYEYLSPGFRSSVTSVQYQKSILLQRIEWTNAKYIESDCTETTCKVSILLEYTMRGGLPGVQTFKGNDVIEESWIRTDNVWYLVPQQ